MKKPFLITFLLACSFLAVSQNLKFPDDFKVGDAVFRTMALYKPDEKSRYKDLKSNPAVIKDRKLIEKVIDKATAKNAWALYYEIYKDEAGSFAGVYIVKYKNKAALEKSLSQKKPVSYAAYLTNDRFLVTVIHRNPEAGGKVIDSLIKFYTKKINAELRIDYLKGDDANEVMPLEMTRPVHKDGRANKKELK